MPKISAKEVQVYLYFKARPGEWRTVDTAAVDLGEISPRTVRRAITKLRGADVLDIQDIIPATLYSYQPAQVATGKARKYAAKLDAAAEALGLAKGGA